MKFVTKSHHESQTSHYLVIPIYKMGAHIIMGSVLDRPNGLSLNTNGPLIVIWDWEMALFLKAFNCIIETLLYWCEL